MELQKNYPYTDIWICIEFSVKNFKTTNHNKLKVILYTLKGNFRHGHLEDPNVIG